MPIINTAFSESLRLMSLELLTLVLLGMCICACCGLFAGVCENMKDWLPGCVFGLLFLTFVC
jgi:hypothetical protein